MALAELRLAFERRHNLEDEAYLNRLTELGSDIRQELKKRGLSIATPDLTGEDREIVLRSRLAKALERETRAKYQAPFKSPAARIDAYRKLRSEVAYKRMERALVGLDFEEVQAAVKHGADPNHLMRNGQTALMRAALYREHSAMKALVAAGAHVDGISSEHETPLFASLREGAMESAQTLVELGASLSTECNGVTPLMLAATQPNLTALAWLIESGAPINGRSSDGTTALMWAARHQNVEAVRLLMVKGADLNLLDHGNRNAAFWAQQSGLGQLAHLLQPRLPSAAASLSDSPVPKPAAIMAAPAASDRAPTRGKNRRWSVVPATESAIRDIITTHGKDVTHVVGAAHSSVLPPPPPTVAASKAVTLAPISSPGRPLTRQMSARDHLVSTAVDPPPAIREARRWSTGVRPHHLFDVSTAPADLQLTQLVSTPRERVWDANNPASDTDEDDPELQVIEPEDAADADYTGPRVQIMAPVQRKRSKRQHRRSIAVAAMMLRRNSDAEQSLLARAALASQKRGRRGAVSKHEADGRILYDNCQHCGIRIARLQCSNCGQVQCEECCIFLHRSAARRHHKVSPVAPQVSKDGIAIRDAALAQPHLLSASIGIAASTVETTQRLLFRKLGLLPDHELLVPGAAGNAQLQATAKVDEIVRQHVQAKVAKIGELRDAQYVLATRKLQQLYTNPAELELAQFLLDQSRPAEAVKDLSTLLSQQEKQFNKTHPNLVPTLRLLGRAHRANNQLPEAVVAFRRAVDILLEQPECVCSEPHVQEMLQDYVGVLRSTLAWRVAEAILTNVHGRLQQENPIPADLASKIKTQIKDCETEGNRLELAQQDVRAHERSITRAARQDYRNKLKAAREQRIKGMTAAQQEQYRHDYPSDHELGGDDSDNAEFVDGQLVHVHRHYQVTIRPEPSQLEACLAHDRWVGLLLQFAKTENNREPVQFLDAVNQFRLMPAPQSQQDKKRLPMPSESRLSKASQIYARFLKSSSHLPSVPMEFRNRIAKAIQEGIDTTTFDQAYEAVADLVVRTLFVRFLDHKLGRRWALERGLHMGLPRWGVPALAKLAGKKRTKLTIKCQAVVRGGLCRIHLRRAKARAEAQQLRVNAMILRGRARTAAAYVLDVVLARVPVIYSMTLNAAKAVAPVLAHRIVNDRVHALVTAGVPLDVLAQRRVVKAFARQVLSNASSKAVEIQLAAQRLNRQVMKVAFRKAVSKIVHLKLEAGEHVALVVAPPPPVDVQAELEDDAQSVDSDPGGMRPSLAVERAAWSYRKRLRWAVLLVQRAWRGHIARERFRAFISSLYIKKYDRETKKYYFVNTRTGERKELLSVQGAEDVKLTITCSQCRLRAATRTCVECEDTYCDSCFADNHVKGARASHSYAPVTEKTVVCQVCKDQVITRFCESCDQGFCAGCYEERHKQGPKKRHQWRRALRNIVWVFIDEPVTVAVCVYCNERMQSVQCQECDDLFCEECWVDRHSKGKRATHRRRRFPPRTKRESAVLLQCWWRSIRARRRLIKMMRQLISVHYDETSGLYYYVNKRTGEVSWNRPLLMGHETDVVLPTETLSYPDAARRIQAFWRATKSKMQVRKMMQGVYSKVLDPESGLYYYVNNQTGTKRWTKPALLGSADVPRIKASDMTWDQAASKLQAIYRAKMARRRLRALIKQVYKKVYDEASGFYYYLNTVTGETSWEKPKLLVGGDVARVHASDLTPDQAASMIQRGFRAFVARTILRRIVREAYAKAVDETTGMVYYVNTRTGESQWTRPKLFESAKVEDAQVVEAASWEPMETVQEDAEP